MFFENIKSIIVLKIITSIPRYMTLLTLMYTDYEIFILSISIHDALNAYAHRI